MSMRVLMPGAVFLSVSGLVLVTLYLAGRRKERLDGRLRELSGKGPSVSRTTRLSRAPQLARSTLPSMAAPLLPGSEEQRTRLQSRFLHAGLYGRQALPIFLAVKMTLMLAPWALGLTVGLLGLTSLIKAMVAGGILGLVGMYAPGLWLDRRKARRQAALQRALPDALDVLVLCLEGGLSLTSAFRRLADEFRTADRLLGLELNIVQREMHLGLSLAEALGHFVDRTDLDEVRGLALIVEQAERFGTGLVKALRIHAESLRFQRVQRAEERAQQAGARILLPTLLFIFPGVFIIILGPAAMQLRGLLAQMKTQQATVQSAVQDEKLTGAMK